MNLRVDSVHLDTCTSTQDIALSEFLTREMDHKDPLVLFVDTLHQSHGRGRRGREWEDHKSDSLLFTAAIKVNDELNAHLKLLPLMAGQCLYKLCSSITESNPNLCLKWPNDLGYYQNDQEFFKIAGVLCELKKGVCLIGWGINLNHSPLANSKSLSELIGKKLDRNLFYSQIKQQWIQDLQSFFIDSEGFKCALIQNLKEKSMAPLWGKNILYNQKQVARALDINNDGELLIEYKDPQGTLIKEYINSGDVSIHQEHYEN